MSLQGLLAYLLNIMIQWNLEGDFNIIIKVVTFQGSTVIAQSASHGLLTCILVLFLDVTCRICFCTADKLHEKIFGYIARNTENETIECYAFLCPKKKIVSIRITIIIHMCIIIFPLNQYQKIR